VFLFILSSHPDDAFLELFAVKFDVLEQLEFLDETV
jgi:hypothetical protein